MATSASDQPSTDNPAQNASASRGSSRPGSGHDARAASPVEMRTLQTAALEPSSTSPATQAPETSAIPPTTLASTVPSSEVQSSQLVESASETMAPSSTARPPLPTELSRAETEAIGPSTDTPAAKADSASGPVVIITLLLTTGARHPYKIDEKYLKKRNVAVDAMDPYNISVYTLKELIWRDWREEWEPRPTSPSSIRLIHFGRMLDDKSPLKECRFQTESPNVVHMTVKPQEAVDEEDAKNQKGGNRRGDEEESHAGCRCVIL
ncbi:ubiquitin-related domain-containing protein [Clohesyomyces aquaticus]|uniref:Ubiquitin-related domain-containing protein n=1 Tax=Clohesyomyces aquaticus TaxID=1231657 RepID=A0A1Y1ZTV7_9PLEO|nr:ubiquitin-related domain-containing protein [Clohesyomyces aquaticus]